MSTPSLLKRAAVYGVQHELIRNGLAHYPSKLAADAAADEVAAGPAAEAMPEQSPDAGHDPAHMQQVAQQLIQLGEQMMQQAASGPQGAAEMGVPPGGAPEAEAAEMGKAASDNSLERIAADVSLELMHKTAAETSPAVKVEIAKDSNKNTPESAGKTEGIAALDQSQRSTSEYNVGVGNTAMDTSGGEVGEIKKHPETPKNSPSGTNSVLQDPKIAAYFAQKVAEAVGKKVEISKGSNKNTPGEAAMTEGIAALDKKQRPAGYALLGHLGDANFSEPQAARTGVEMPHPEAPKTHATGASTNSVIDASKAAQDNEIAAYTVLFNKTAALVGEYLPPTLNETGKTAAINNMMGMTMQGRANFIASLARAKTAGELAEILGMSPATEEPAGEKKKDEDKDEKKKEAAAKSDLFAKLQRIADSAAK